MSVGRAYLFVYQLEILAEVMREYWRYHFFSAKILASVRIEEF